MKSLRDSHAAEYQWLNWPADSNVLCRFANYTQSYLHKYKHKNIQTINQSMAGYIQYSFAPWNNRGEK